MLRSPGAYSTSGLGYIRTVGDVVSVLAPVPKSELDILAQLKQNERSAVLQKIRSAFLYHQISKYERDRIFKRSMASSFDPNEEPKFFDITAGSTSERIRLSPRRYLGPPSKKELRILISTSRTADDLNIAIPYMLECLKTKELGSNFPPQLGGYTLRRAAEAGIFQSAFNELTTQSAPLKLLLNRDFFHDALRIHALRIPYLSHGSIDMLNSLYWKANINISRELIFLYGLSQYNRKFSEGGADALSQTINRIQELIPSVLKRPRAALKKISQTDLVMARDGLNLCDLPESRGLVKSIEDIMHTTARNRPLTVALSVNLADVGLESTRH